ncbi:hypothetical protein GBF38_022263 [Nibea albiflora]|uniref:Uncharacterized protein n=1 Tax=Nibea albiflora TaxID=240163 RepID=A0ACB7FLG4_NIBAL|nr:hypothetical protein GBF38_022263 [Nibea albiflora]
MHIMTATFAYVRLNLDSAGGYVSDPNHTDGNTNHSVKTQEKTPSLRERWIDKRLSGGREEEGVEEVVEGEQVKKQRMNKESQDGNKRGPETNGGEKPMHPEPIYKYHLRRGVDDGKRMETG